MAAIGEADLRDELRDRRRRLEAAIAAGGDTAALARLAEEVDAALERMERGTYGLCEACHESIEVERLFADPLLRTCLDHLTPAERRALEQDLDLASRIQRGLLPRTHLSFPGWEVAYRYEPAGAVGGDYCDVIGGERDAGDLYFILGDVSGKGMGASMLMSALRAIVRTLMGSGLAVNHLVERANRLFCETALPQHFATLVCGRATAAGEVEICNAGHCLPLLATGGQVTPVEATGLPVGLFSTSEYSVRQLRLDPGDSLLLYTDGLSEARDRSDADYGAERLARILAQRRALPPRELVAACLEDVSSFRSGATRTDDLTLMAIRRTQKA